MRHERFSLRTTDLDRVADLVAETVEVEHRYDGDGFAVLQGEEYEFWRTNSNLQLTVVLERVGDRIDVEVSAGGGGAGVFGLTFGNESSALDSAVRGIMNTCERAGIEVR